MRMWSCWCAGSECYTDWQLRGDHPVATGTGGGVVERKRSSRGRPLRSTRLARARTAGGRRWHQRQGRREAQRVLHFLSECPRLLVRKLPHSPPPRLSFGPSLSLSIYNESSLSRGSKAAELKLSAQLGPFPVVSACLPLRSVASSPAFTSPHRRLRHLTTSTTAPSAPLSPHIFCSLFSCSSSSSSPSPSRTEASIDMSDSTADTGDSHLAPEGLPPPARQQQLTERLWISCPRCCSH